MPLAVALVAGAVVAPTDAVAATSVFARLDVPERLVTIVEGEGLTNDGTALVLYTGAVGAAMVGAVGPGRWCDAACRSGGRCRAGPGRRLAGRARAAANRQLVVGDHSLAGDAIPHLCARRRRPSLRRLGHGDRRRLRGFAPQAIFAPGARLQAFAFLDVLVFLLNAVLFTLVGMELWRSLHWVPGMAAGRVVAVISAVDCRGDRIAAGVDAVRSCHRAAVRARDRVSRCGVNAWSWRGPACGAVCRWQPRWPSHCDSPTGRRFPTATW